MNGKGGSFRAFGVGCLLVLFSAGSAAAGGGKNKNTGPDPSDLPPSAPVFTGEKTLTRPCEFRIQVSATDVMGDLSGFRQVTGTLPPGFGLTLDQATNTYVITGAKTCATGTWTSSWVAFDRAGGDSPSSNLVLTCNRGGETAKPTPPTYSGEVTSNAPCNFWVHLNSTDPNGHEIDFRLKSPRTCLPPDHEFNGSAIVGRQSVWEGQWTCSFSAVNDYCEESAPSSVTLTCGPPLTVTPTNCAVLSPGSQQWCSCCAAIYGDAKANKQAGGTARGVPTDPCLMYSSMCF